MFISGHDGNLLGLFANFPILDDKNKILLEKFNDPRCREIALEIINGPVKYNEIIKNLREYAKR